MMSFCGESAPCLIYINYDAFCGRGTNMFAVLELYEVGNSFRERVKRRFRKPDISIDRPSIYDGMHYYAIKAPVIDGEIDWQGIREAAGGCRSRMLIPENLRLPDDAGLVRFRPTVFQRIILFNTAVSLLSLCEIPPGDTIVSVVDYNMLDTKRLYSLLPYASIVKVITSQSKLEAYENFADKLYKETGARITVTDNIESALNSNLVLSAEEYEDEALRRCRVLSFYPLENTPKALCIGCVELTYGVKLPFYEGIPMIDFLGALYELCPPSERLTPIRAKTLMTRNFEITLPTAALLMKEDIDEL